MGPGLTIISKVIGEPTQVLRVGVAIIVAVTGVAPAFSPAKDKMSPLPFVAKPMEASEFVQSIIAPEGLLKKLIVEVLLFTQTV